MSSNRTCPECGTELPAGVSPWLCPKCLLAQARNGASGPTSDSPEPAPGESPGSEPTGESLPRRLGGYELLERVGQGGMGIVYRARQLSLDRFVAVKVLPQGALATKEEVLRFRTEAAAAGSLQHPHIVAIHEVGLCEDRHYLVMDFVEGQTLAQLARGGPLGPRRAACYVQTIAEAVHHAHEHGILHRDLKPSNVLIDAADQPRISDFGLAKRLESGSDLTLTGQVLGSPQYMAPEQAAGRRRQVSRRSDVYALGAILYHLLTGRPPFVGETLSEILPQVANDEPLRPRQLNPALPIDLETICLKCLEKEPGRRYPTALAVAEELGRFLRSEPTVARPVGVVGRLWRWCRRKPQVACLTGVAALAVALGLTGVLSEWRRAEAQRRRAEAGELAAQQRAYISEINQAEQALKDGNPGRALELLNRCRPTDKSQIDLRGFEWRYLWQQCPTEDESFLGRLPSGIRSLEVSPDGRWLLATSAGGAVKVWNLSTGEQIAVAAEAGAKGNGTFSTDSLLLLFTDQTLESFGTIGILDLQTRQRLTPITNSWAVGPMAFSPDGKWLSYGLCSPSRQRRLVVLDFATRKKIAEHNPRTTFASAHHGFGWVFTGDSRSFIFSESDPDIGIGLCGVQAGSEPHYFPGHREGITALAISPDGQTLASGAGFTETTIRLWDVPTFRPRGELAGHEKWIVGLAFSPDGRTLASGSADHTVRLWDVPTRSPKWVSRRLAHEVWRVCFAPDGRTLFSGSGGGTIRRWSLNAPPAARVFWTNVAKLDAEAVAPDGTQIAGIRNGIVCLGDARGVAPPSPLPELGTNNTCLLFSADGQTLFAGTQTGEVQVWPVLRHRGVRRLHGAADPVRLLGQDARGDLLLVMQWKGQVVAGSSWRVGIWSTARWVEQRSWHVPGLRLACAVSPDGRWFATGGNSSPLRLWNLRERSETNCIATFAGSVTTAGLAFSTDGRLLVAADNGGVVKAWAIPGFRELPGFRAHRGPVRGLALSPDSRRLATAGDGDEAVKLWDVATWQELITLERPGETLETVAFSADGNQLTARNSQGDVLFWRVPTRAEIEAAEKKSNAR